MFNHDQMETGIQSVPPQETMPAAGAGSGSSEFTVGNLIGLFLTLCLCLLSQPWGSLLYRPLYKDWPVYVQLCFFVWRLNPIACVAEAFVIAGCLLDTAFTLWRDYWKSFDGIHSSVWTDRFHITAAALFLLRADEHDGEPIEARLGNWLGLSYSEAYNHGSTADGPRAGTLHERLRPTESDREDETTQAMSSLTPDVMALTSSAHVPGRPRLVRTRSVRAPARLYGSTTHEAAAPPEEMHPLQEVETALGMTVLARKERWTYLMAGFAVLVVLVKLIATSLPRPLRIAAMSMWVGWFAVQSLLCLFHLRELNESAVEPIIAAARRYRSLIGHPYMGWTVRSVVMLAVGYLSYFIGFTLFFPVPGNELGIGIAIVPLPKFEGPLQGDIGLLRALIYLPVSLPLLIQGTLIPLSLLSILPAGAAIAATMPFEASGWSYSFGMFVVCPLVMAVEVYFLEFIGIADYLASIFSLLCMLVSMFTLYWAFLFPCRYFHSGGSTTSAVFVCIGTIIWAYVFAYVVEYYDGTGTYKPVWLDYLG